MAEEEKNTVNNLEAEALETEPNDKEAKVLETEPNDTEAEVLETEPVDAALLETESDDSEQHINEIENPCDSFEPSEVCAILLSFVCFIVFLYYFLRSIDASTPEEKAYNDSRAIVSFAATGVAILFFFYSIRKKIYFAFRIVGLLLLELHRAMMHYDESKARCELMYQRWLESEAAEEACQGDAPNERSSEPDPPNEPKASSSNETQCFTDSPVPEDDSDDRLQKNASRADTNLVKRSKTLSREQSNPDTATS